MSGVRFAVFWVLNLVSLRSGARGCVVCCGA